MHKQRDKVILKGWGRRLQYEIYSWITMKKKNTKMDVQTDTNELRPGDNNVNAKEGLDDSTLSEQGQENQMAG